jgi:hypothetical protein
VQIITDFEKILGRLDEGILVALRGAEQAGRLQSVTFSMYPYRWIKRAWKREGKMLHASKYGDTHWEKDNAVAPCSLKDLAACLPELPGHVLQYFYAWTGGYPAPINAVIREWRRTANDKFTRSMQHSLYEVAVRSFKDIAQYLEPDGEDRFRKLVIDLHTGVEKTQSYFDIKQHHPWARVILDDEGLKADAFGEAVIRSSIESAFLDGCQEREMHDVLRRGAHFYENGQYDIAQDLLSRFTPASIPAIYNIVRIHAAIMSSLCQSELLQPSVDSDWQSVLKSIVEARSVAAGAFENRRQLDLLNEQYEAMYTLASTMLALQERGVRRPVDHLAGLEGAELRVEQAFSLVVLQAEAARSLRGNSFACKAAMELPEQLIRVWAWWSVGVNYYSAPQIEHSIWNAAREDGHRQTVRELPPDEGTEFRGNCEFVCFLKSHIERQTPGNLSSPWPKEGDVARDCSVFQIRNDPAHAVAVLNAGLRRQLFACIDRWIEIIEKDTRYGLSRQRTLDLFSRLPLPDELLDAQEMG